MRVRTRKSRPWRAAVFVAFAVAAGRGEAAERQPARLPAAMTGAWGWSAESCAKADDDGRMVVADRSVGFAAAL